MHARITHTAAAKVDRRTAAPVPLSELYSAALRTDDKGVSKVIYGGRAYAAAKMAMRGDAYSDDDRAEVAAELVSKVTAELPLRAMCSCGGPQTHRRFVTDDYGTAVEVARCLFHSRRGDRPVIGAAANQTAEGSLLYPAHLVSVTRLIGLAANLRRTLDRDRARDTAAAAANAESAELEAHSPAPDMETVRTPYGARCVALDMLRNAGLIGTRLPAPGGRALSPHAPLWALAYTAARAAAGLESAEIAAELDMEPAAHRKALSRAAKELSAVPADAAAWAEALAVLEGGTAKGRAADLPDSFGVRTAPGHTLPNTAEERRTVPASAVNVSTADTAPRRAWHTLPVARRRTAEWATTVPARTASRLAAAAVISRERVAAKSDAQRIADRTAAGIPGTVR